MGDENQTQSYSDKITCSICLEPIKNSKQLPCFHTFCANCLEHIIRFSDGSLSLDGDSIIQCPQCRRNVPVPPNGVDGFPSSYFVVAQCGTSAIESGDTTCGVCDKTESAVGFCIECRKNLCIACKQDHKIDEETQRHHILVIHDEKKTVETLESCNRHPNEELKFFCSQCQEACCRDCRQTLHYGHPALDIAEGAELERDRLATMYDDLQIQVIKFKEAKDEAEAARERMKVEREVIMGKVEARKQEVVKRVQDIYNVGILHLKDNLEMRLKEVYDPLLDIVEEYDHLLRCSEEAADVLKLSNPVRTVTVTKEVEQVLEKYSKMDTKKIDEGSSIFAAGMFPEQALRNYGGLIGFENVNLKRAFHFNTDHLLEFSLIPISKTEAWISFYTSEGSALVLYDSTGKKKEDIPMQPDGSSRALKLGREFLISLKHEKCLMIFKNKTVGMEKFVDVKYSPRGMAMSMENRILICISESDGSHESSLIVLSERGELITEIKEDHNGKNIFVSPRNIAVNINGDMCVTDKGAKCLVILGKDFKVKARYSPPQSLNLHEAFCPMGVCCDRFGRILVADGCNNKVHLLSAHGKFIRFLLKETDGINWPRLVAIGPGDRLWVVCRGHVQVYDYLASIM